MIEEQMRGVPAVRSERRQLNEQTLERRRRTNRESMRRRRAERAKAAHAKKITQLRPLRPTRLFRLTPLPECHWRRAAARYAECAILSKE
jgi:hypothetical protein